MTARKSKKETMKILEEMIQIYRTNNYNKKIAYSMIYKEWVNLMITTHLFVKMLRILKQSAEDNKQIKINKMKVPIKKENNSSIISKAFFKEHKKMNKI